MEQYQLKKPESVKSRKRIGRGVGSGHGKTSGRGQKGAGSRSGYSSKSGFEGGQMPLQRRVPKRGFNNAVFKTEYQIVNLAKLEAMGAASIDAEAMAKAGCIDSAYKLIKILGNGELTKAITVTADAFSNSAKDKIEKAGGQAVVRAIFRPQDNKTE